jgi:hypothetical protein
MMRALSILALACLTPSAVEGQTAAPGPAADTSPAAVVRQWLERLNALSEAPETLDRFVALYDGEALHIAGPTPDQRGTATYRGHRGVRAWAQQLVTREPKRAYRLETETARETTASLVHTTTGPWGGPAVAVQIVATYTDAATGKRYVAPGALFLQLVEGGAIRRARLFIGDGERAEVEAEPTRRRP